MELCKEFKVKKFTCADYSLEFDDHAFIEAVEDGKIENEVSKFRKVATDIEKEYERTLFHSS